MGRKNLPILACIILIIMLVRITQETVVGIDLGSQFIKATLVKPGFPFTIVENTASQRKTPTAVGFSNEQRVYGLDAIMQSASLPSKTFTFMRDLLGMEYNEKNVEILRKQFFYFNDLVPDSRGYVAFKVDLEISGESKEYVFTVEEIISMILAHFKFLAEKQSKGSVKDIVLTVPTSFTMNQRKMLSDAVEMAGLNSIAMIEENIASSIAYGVDRRDDNQTHTAMFLNLGSSDFEVTIANFYAKRDNKTDKHGNVKVGDIIENIEILSQVTDDRVSGRLFDKELLDILAENFNSMKNRVGKADIRENPRIVNRLFKEISKIKDTLSANKEMIVNIPEVADYQNLKMTILRTDFEQKIDKYLQYLQQTIKLALEKAKVEINKLSAVEIIGGALRVPKVKDIFAGIVGEQLLGSHINGDESMSFGAAFLGANISSSFVVRKLYLHKIVEEPIYVNFTSANLSKDDPNYIKKRFMFFDGEENTKRKYIVSSMDDLKVDFYTKSKDVIHTVYLTGIPEILESEEYLNNGTTPKVFLEASFTSNGLIEINSVSAKVTQTRYILKTKKVPSASSNSTLINDTDFITNNTSSNSTISNNSTLSDENVDNSDQIEDQTENNYPENADEKQTNSSNIKNSQINSNFTSVSELVPENKTFTKTMTYREVFIGHQPLTTEQKVTAIAHIVDIEKRDKIILDTLKAKNEFETLIYSSREWISNEGNQVYTTPDVIESYLSKLEQNESWLYEEGYNEKLEAYNKRIQDINSTLSEMKYRKIEHEKRQEMFMPAKLFLENSTAEVETLSSKFPWVDEAKFVHAKEIVANVSKWFYETYNKQEKLSLHENPVLKSDDIVRKMNTVINTFDRISKIPKPKNWAKKNENNKASNYSNATITNSTDDIIVQTFNVTDDQFKDWTINATQGNRSQNIQDDEYKKEDL